MMTVEFKVGVVKIVPQKFYRRISGPLWDFFLTSVNISQEVTSFAVSDSSDGVKWTARDKVVEVVVE